MQTFCQWCQLKISPEQECIPVGYAYCSLVSVWGVLPDRDPPGQRPPRKRPPGQRPPGQISSLLV